MKLVFASDIQEIWPTQKCIALDKCYFHQMHGGQAVNNLNNFRQTCKSRFILCHCLTCLETFLLLGFLSLHAQMYM